MKTYEKWYDSTYMQEAVLAMASQRSAHGNKGGSVWCDLHTRHDISIGIIIIKKGVAGTQSIVKGIDTCRVGALTT